MHRLSVGEIPLLWIAVNTGNQGLLDRLLSLAEGSGQTIVDHGAPDGTTAFAIALGRKSTRMAVRILTSPAVGEKGPMLELCFNLPNGHEVQRELLPLAIDIQSGHEVRMESLAGQTKPANQRYTEIIYLVCILNFATVHLSPKRCLLAKSLWSKFILSIQS